MKRTVNVNFSDGFEFPKEYDYKHCGEKCVFSHFDTYDCVEYCTISNEKNECPFFGKSDDEVIEVE